MRRIDRGLEPDGVAGYARQYTQGWIEYFQNGQGDRPTDFLWSVFRPTMASRSNNNCWYCERQCDSAGELAPSVDHFRPLRLFPQLAYDWTNWVFSCQRCNSNNRKDKWPEAGYVDPCAQDIRERPDRYFDYDTDTGEIIPRESLSADARQRASYTIGDLGLNKLDIMYYRLQWVRQFVTDLLTLPVSERQAFAEYITQQPAEFTGTTGMVIEQLRQEGSL